MRVIVKNKAVKFFLYVILFFIFLFLLFRFFPYPELEKFLDNYYSLRVVDREGELISVLQLSNGERREFVSIKECPDYVKKIFIRSEDKRFYFHFGFDPVAIVRSFFINVKNKKIVTGASTITMQLARIISPRETTVYNKILEIFDAIKLEARFSKNRILELYLNSIPYGYQTIGIRSASFTFFGKDITSLNAGESLALAIIPRSPEKYNTFLNKENLIKEVILLAKRLDPKLLEDEIRRDLSEVKSFTYVNRAIHFINFIKDKIDIKDLKKGGIYQVSLYIKLNEIINEKIRYNLKKWNKFRVKNASLIAIDNKTGEIILYIGSNDFNDKENSGEIDGVHIKNQPGSTLKPFLYALALEKGFTPATILPDIPMDFGEEDLYFPLNFSRRFNGPVRLRAALASSLNVPAVYLASRVGVQNFIEKLIDLEFDSLKFQRASLGVGVALGNARVSLFELTRAFSVFPRKGESNEITFKKELKRNFKNGRKIFSEYSALLISNILSDNSSRVLGFSPTTVLNTRFPAMFKTGTSNQYNNVWTVGATTEFTVGVWVGNFSGETVIGEVANSLPATICVETLEILNEYKKGDRFMLPEEVVTKDICVLSGMLATENCEHKIKEYFRKDDKVNFCSFHKKVNDKVVVEYPQEYSHWANKSKRENISFQKGFDEKLPKIVRPNNNSMFYFDPNIPEKNQAVKIEVVNFDDSSLSLFINNKYEKELTYPYIYYLPLKRGKWSIEVKGKNGSDRVLITIL